MKREIQTEVQANFPTPWWITNLDPVDAAVLNARLKAEIERILEPRSKLQPGGTWNTPQDLHTRPAFFEFVKLVEAATNGVARFLHIEQYPMVITGCWANINPPGSSHHAHLHPNNYLSGVYYVAIPPSGSVIQFHDPRPMLIMPKLTQFTQFTANTVNVESKEGRLIIFPSWLRHSVPANQDESERISISFDLMFKDFTETMAKSKVGF